MARRQTIERLQQVLARRIREFRTAAGLTQERLAEKVDISPQYLSRLETGRRVPSLDVVAELAEALNTTPSALVAEPQEDTHAELTIRMAAIFRALDREDAAFLESQLASWISHLKSLRHEKPVTKP